MRAAWYEQLGEAKDVLQYGDMATPVAGPGQVRIRVSFSGVNRSDVKRRGGRGTDAISYPRIIPGQDGAGVIDSVGEGVPSSRVGERVWVYEAQLGRPYGTSAEFVVVPSENAVQLPSGTDFETGATLGIPAMMAHSLLFDGEPVEGKTVLVAGGAGACGSFAVQLAKLRGATVIATVSSEDKADVARESKADHVLNYRREDVASRVMDITGGAGVDRVVEVAFGANLALDIAMLKAGGVISTYSSDSEPEPRIPFSRMINKCVTVHFVRLFAHDRGWHQKVIEDLGRCLEGGKLRPHIAERYPLSDAVKAHEAVEQGRPFGRILIST